MEKAELCKKEFDRQNFINDLKQEFESLKGTLHNKEGKTAKGNSLLLQLIFLTRSFQIYLAKDSQKLEATLDDVEAKLKDETKSREESMLRIKELKADLHLFSTFKK